MRRVVDELSDPEDHLALDEALLVEADQDVVGESLRVWEFHKHVVVAGRSTRIDDEVDRPYCQAQGIPVLRRCSGGASVVGGPGCLMYTVVLSLAGRVGLNRIDVAHQYVMTRVLAPAGSVTRVEVPGNLRFDVAGSKILRKQPSDRAAASALPRNDPVRL